MLLLRLHTLFLLLVFTGCADPFPPATLVERLRILGVKAEPPETNLSGDVNLTALVIDPAGAGRPLDFTWAVCLVRLESVAMDIPCPGTDSYSLEGEGSSTMIHMPDLADWLAEQGYSTEPAGDLPEEERFPFVGLKVIAGDEHTRAIMRLMVRLSEDEEEPNQNPALLGLELDGDPVGDDVTSLPAGAKVTLTPLADESTRQIYRREGDEDDRIEDFMFSWFSTAGNLSDQRTILDIDSRGNRLDTNEWKLSEEPGVVTLWLVVRDGRYGVDWLEYHFDVVEAD